MLFLNDDETKKEFVPITQERNRVSTERKLYKYRKSFGDHDKNNCLPERLTRDERTNEYETDDVGNQSFCKTFKCEHVIDLTITVSFLIEFY